MFFIHSTKQNAGVLGWPLKLFNGRRSKVCLTRSMPQHHIERIFLAFYAPSQIFLWDPAKLWPGENTAYGSDSHRVPSTLYTIFQNGDSFIIFS